jgi:hypothetical protein
MSIFFLSLLLTVTRKSVLYPHAQQLCHPRTPHLRKPRVGRFSSCPCGDRLAVKDAGGTSRKRQFEPGSPRHSSGAALLEAARPRVSHPGIGPPRRPTGSNISLFSHFCQRAHFHNVTDWARYEYPSPRSANRNRRRGAIRPCVLTLASPTRFVEGEGLEDAGVYANSKGGSLNQGAGALHEPVAEVCCEVERATRANS